jgi:hypothetical protein
MPVAVAPGQIALTRMPLPPNVDATSQDLNRHHTARARAARRLEELPQTP